MKYLVTGGAGFIGTNLCEKLIEKKHEVIALDNLSITKNNVEHLKEIGVVVHKKDIIDFNEIRDSFSGVDVVVHLAAMNRAQRSIEDPLGANEVNITATLNCLEAARLAGVKRFVNISSSSVYANQRDVLLSEEMPLSPPHPYGIGKLAGEHYTRVYKELFDLDTVSLRFFSVYGPRQLGDIDKAGVVAKFIHHAMTGQSIEIYGDGKQLRNFSFVGDVADCVICASEEKTAIGHVINIANEEEVSVSSLAELVLEVTGKRVNIIHTDPLKGDPSRNPANVEKCRQILGVSPSTTFQDGIQKTLDWYMKANIS